MNKTLLAWAALAAMACGTLAGCGTDADDSSQEAAGDCIVTAVKMGGLVCTRHTLSSAGTDSTYHVTVQGSYYPMSIDNVNGRIYNADSLPVGTDASRVAFSTFNASGITAIRSLATGADSTFSAKDSTDFTRPRQITVYAENGNGKRTYTVEVRVHKEEADTFRWNKVGVADDRLAALAYPRLLAKDGRLLAFGLLQGNPTLLAADLSAPGAWDCTDLSATGMDPSSVQLTGGKLYALAGGGIIRSDDGLAWEKVETAFVPQALVAAGSNRLYALAGGRLHASPDGTVWEEESMDEPALFPTAGFAACHAASPVDKLTENLLLTGGGPAGPVVWKKVTDLTGHEHFAWTYLPSGAENPYPCPALQDATLAAYDGCAVMAGRLPDGACALYVSRDLGRTWKPGDIKLPPAASGTGCAVASGDGGYLWLLFHGTGEVWKGRYNRLGWATATGEAGR